MLEKKVFKRFLPKKVLKGFLKSYKKHGCILFNRLTHKQAIIEIEDPAGRPQYVYFRSLKSDSNSEAQ